MGSLGAAQKRERGGGVGSSGEEPRPWEHQCYDVPDLLQGQILQNHKNAILMVSGPPKRYAIKVV